MSESKEENHTCGTCRYFRRFTKQYDVKYFGGHAGNCHNDDKFVYDLRPVPIDGVTYWDAENYSAGFTVGERFGCVHWRTADASMKFK